MTIRKILLATSAISILAYATASAQPPAPPQGPAANDDSRQPGQKREPRGEPGQKREPRGEPGQKQPPQAQPPARPVPPAAQGQPPAQTPPPPAAAKELPKQPDQKRDAQRPDASPPGAPGRAQGQPPAPPPAPTAQDKKGPPPAPTAQERKGPPPAPTAQDKKGLPPAPTAQEKKQELQRPAQQQPQQPQTLPRQQPAQTPPAQPVPPAAQVPPAQPQAPSAQTPPSRPVPPAAQTAPAQPVPPAAQTAPAQPVPPAAQAQPIPAAPQGQAIQLPGTNARRVDQLRGERRETRDGDRVTIQEGDRTIVREGGRTIIRHSETDRFRYGARDVRVERQGAETITVIERPDGARIVTVTDANGRLVRRTRRDPAGREIIIIDNRHAGPSAGFYVQLPPPTIRIPRERYIMEAERASEADIYETLIAPPVERLQRRYTLEEVRYSPEVRARMPRVDIDTITFETGSWEITPDQAPRLAVIAAAIKRAVNNNPSEVFLIEGHTDAVGADIDNLSLSDRRAESVALVLTQQFQVPAENLTTQGYGEQYLKVQTDGAERQNRRVTMRRITPLLSGEGGQPQQGG
jgi:outer membrane protein OmpA-like peptidoglycan-associated protein